jgi:hypothetical protein
MARMDDHLGSAIDARAIAEMLVDAATSE